MTTTNNQHTTSLTKEQVEIFDRQPISITLTGSQWAIVTAGLVKFGSDAVRANDHQLYQGSEDIYCEVIKQIRLAGQVYRQGTASPNEG